MNIKPALAIVTALIIAGILLGDRPTTPTTSAAPPPHTSRPQPATPRQHDAAVEGDGFHAPDQPPVETPSYDGGEDPTWTLPAEDQLRAVSAAGQFIDGWLQPDPTLRTQMLRPVAAEALIADLAGDDLRIWTTTATGGPQIVELASTNALLRQPLTDGRSVDLLLTAEPGSLHGWIVTDIAPATGR
ncbi:hypothetical protein H5398_15675 [Tessaracoccus sp. MC1679]|uniref:hypothetical protein n=1 Tax=Tessaracoccus sp. MC1679 TaxID=2760313 RepID=UPI0015FF8C81|nr:hypothetical protein [Tessaracoccus sp. MC1679]MBB1517394.1 hypothetical protein [Tessaracoccus sp. MC1679]